MGEQRVEQQERAPALSIPRVFSILSERDEFELACPQEPSFFRDLNLDQVVAAITSGREEYDLTRFFSVALHSEDAVEYRHEVFRDLEQQHVAGAVRAFSEQMQSVRRRLGLAKKQHHKREQQRWFLDAAVTYCEAASQLARSLADLDLGSRGLQAFRAYLTSYAASQDFRSLAAETERVLEGLARVSYALRIRGKRVTVSAYADERDYSVEVEQTFARFRQGRVEDHRFKLADSGSMDHIEARIADLVARLYPDAFQALDAFCTRHRDFVDQTILRFDGEVQFYLAYLEHRDRLASEGLPFCFPVVSATSKEIEAEEAFDIALASKLDGRRSAVVCNDFCLRDPERVLVVTGPNQGGKTTFARMFGQLHYLASLGLPVPGQRARLHLYDRLFTHFEREEDIANLRGKLEDELVRVRQILEQASGNSIIILNEIFTSTTLDDAIYLGTEVLEQVVELGSLAVCVTFVDELASLAESTVSMVATVDLADPAKRTFKIVRKPADGRAYAWAIAAKYGLSYDALKDRIEG